MATTAYGHKLLDFSLQFRSQELVYHPRPKHGNACQSRNTKKVQTTMLAHKFFTSPRKYLHLIKYDIFLTQKVAIKIRVMRKRISINILPTAKIS